MENLQVAGASQQENPKQKEYVSASYSVGSSSARNLEALEAQLGGIDSQILGLSGQLNHAKSFVERGQIQMQPGRLQAQKQALIARLRDARQQQVNQTLTIKNLDFFVVADLSVKVCKNCYRLFFNV